MLKKTGRSEKRGDRVRRVRAKVSGTEARPRMVVFRSLKNITVQVIDDQEGKTLVSARLGEMKAAKNTVEGALALGKLVGKKCVAAKITTVVYDRAGFRYHGKVKAVADGAREAGLTF
jgi:large subunit ribosomal protein L18